MRFIYRFFSPYIIIIIMPHGCTFNKQWISIPEYKEWLVEDKDKYSAFCKLCQKPFKIDTMATSAIRSHMEGKKHQEKLKSLDRSQNLVTMFSAARTAASRPATSANTDAMCTALNEQSTLDNYIRKKDIVKAEILWTLNCNQNGYSNSSCEGNNEIFRAMFTDSEIAYKCGETKTMYISCFGLAPHFNQMLERKVRMGRSFVLLFDESLNNHLQKKQLDYHVRIWEHDRVVTRYVTSDFLGHATAGVLE
jgi:hypothetical protein